MLEHWFSHCYQAPVQFERTGDALIITTDAADSRGSWIAWHNAPVFPGQKFQLFGTHQGGEIRALFFKTQSDYMSGTVVEPGGTFEIPDEATMLRIDCRLWGEQGRAVFQSISIMDCTSPEEQPLLPIPAPDILEERYIVGYKWGRNIFVFDNSEEGPSVPVDRGDAYEVTGVQRNRDIHLKVGNIIKAEIEDKEQEL